MAQVFNMGKTLNTLTTGVNKAISTVNLVSKNVNNVAQSLGALGNVTSVQGALGQLTNITNSIKNAASAIENLTDIGKFGSNLRKASIPDGGEYGGEALGAAAIGRSQASFVNDVIDWRVRLSMPAVFENSTVLQPLINSDKQLIFPYTPTITMSGSANYEDQSVTHQNYQFIYYNNSRAEQIQIVAPFNVEDGEQALYWIAAVHFLRSVTKMFTGADSIAGNPPPILRLNGYGEYVFNNIPVVVKQFSIDMPQDVNYINALGRSWVPTKSTMNLTLQPIYSRSAVREFSLTNFVNGNYIGKGYL